MWVERSDGDPVPVVTLVALFGLVAAGLLAWFGMPPLNLHSPLHFVGVMDPFCGVTRGSAATMRGDLGDAWWYNPASPLVIVGGLAVVGRSIVGQATGRWVCVCVERTRLSVALAGVAFVVLDVYQQLHVDRLR